MRSNWTWIDDFNFGMSDKANRKARLRQMRRQAVAAKRAWRLQQSKALAIYIETGSRLPMYIICRLQLDRPSRNRNREA